ncbi:MAG: radical SAM protein [Desulfovibrionaceae bacterium]
MDYVGRIIRPPSEAGSILLQVTTGCSHNKCTFCAAYKDKRFSIKDSEVISRDIREAAREYEDVRRLFLCDGDALVIPQARLLALLEEIRTAMPRLTRIATYASAKALGMKTDEQLAELREAGLGMCYMGLESGHAGVLERVRKHGTPERIMAQGRRVRQAGMKLNVTVLLGLGGRERSREHAEATGRALSAMDPDQAAALSLMLVPGTELHAEAQRGEFQELSPHELLDELRTLLEHLDLSRGLFMANHASNHLPLKVRLPGGKAEALARIDAALAGAVALKPESARRL